MTAWTEGGDVMVKDKGRLIKLASACIPHKAVTSFATCDLRHGRVRLKTTQQHASQQHTEEESPSVWRSVRDDHGCRLVCTRTVCADQVRTAGPQGFEGASLGQKFCRYKRRTLRGISGHKRAGTRLGESEEKVRHP